MADCSNLGLGALHVPDLAHDNPHRGSIWDLVGLSKNDPQRYEHALDALARASTVV